MSYNGELASMIDRQVLLRWVRLTSIQPDDQQLHQ
jgi:hypothetical protein